MKILAWNIVLAFAWCAFAGQLTLLQFGVGFAIAFVVLGWLVPIEGARAYVLRVPRALGFLGAYAIEVVQSALHVAWDVITPVSRRWPAIVAVPLACQSEAQIALLANLITFTPGTLALDVTPDRRTMIVHGMFVRDIDATRDSIKRLEARVLRIVQ